MLSESYDRNNSHVVTYAYDNEDNLGSVTDKRNNITQRYLYDLSGRQTEIIQSGSASRRQQFQYDEANNLSRYDETVNGKYFVSFYKYDKDNRQSKYQIGSIDRLWQYDGYGRLYDVSTKLGANQVLHTTIYHENPDSTHVSTRVNGWKTKLWEEIPGISSMDMTVPEILGCFVWAVRQQPTVIMLCSSW